jgi:hypothetical protein
LTRTVERPGPDARLFAFGWRLAPSAVGRTGRSIHLARTLKKKTKSPSARNLDKHLFEAGQQCHKRLWLDYHDPKTAEAPATRQEMARVGAELRQLARAAFPKGIAIEAESVADAVAETREQLDKGAQVLFDAAFEAVGVEARCDILVVHKDKKVDLFEVKSGVKVKHRYVNDLALQAHVLEQCGLTLRAAFLLHLNPQYTHKDGADYPPMQLLRSADVTSKVQKQRALVVRRLTQFRTVVGKADAPKIPMGTYCTDPFPCPHLATCAAAAPAHPLYELPELDRALETALHKEGIDSLMSIDRDREGLTPRQQRTLTCVQTKQAIVEPFIAEELKACQRPLHFLALMSVTEALPRFDNQRPWRQTPYAFAVRTVHRDGRAENATFAHFERTDPRPTLMTALAKHLEVGGTVICWNDEQLNELRSLLDDLPEHKAAVRGVVSRQHLDMMKLLEEGLFQPTLTARQDLRATLVAVLGDKSGNNLPGYDAEDQLTALQKATAPRIRSTTRDKLAAEVVAALDWQCESLAKLYLHFAPTVVKPAPSKAPARKAPSKPLPKLPE